MTPFFIHFQALTVSKTVTQILGKKPIWTAHHTFLESKNPMLNYVCYVYCVLFPQVSRKS